MRLAGHSKLETTHRFYLAVADDLVDRARHASDAALGQILARAWRLAKKGAELTLTNLQPQVEKVFEIIRLLPTFKVFRDREELDEYLGRIQRQVTGQDDD